MSTNVAIVCDERQRFMKINVITDYEDIYIIYRIIDYEDMLLGIRIFSRKGKIITIGIIVQDVFIMYLFYCAVRKYVISTHIKYKG